MSFKTFFLKYQLKNLRRKFQEMNERYIRQNAAYAAVLAAKDDLIINLSNRIDKLENDNQNLRYLAFEREGIQQENESPF